eukprot:PhM_4_TR4817/c0_g3_i1/m.37876
MQPRAASLSDMEEHERALATDPLAASTGGMAGHRTRVERLKQHVVKRVAGVAKKIPKPRMHLPRSASWTDINDAAEMRDAVSRVRLQQRNTAKAPPPFDPKLHFAAASGDIDAVISLLETGDCDVNQADYERRTPLHVAASMQNTRMVEVLVKYKADVNFPDARSRTPLFDAGENQEIVEFLKRHGAVDSLKFFAKKAKEEDKAPQGTMESTDVINNHFLRKVLVTFLTPLVILLLLNGTWFAFKFLLGTLVYYVVLVAYFVSEITIRPPWYRPNAKKLTMHALPEYWQGIVNDPKYDLGLDFEDIEFYTEDKYKLLGWYVPAPKESTSTTGVVLVHGGGRDRRAFLRHVRMLHEEGFPVVLFDFREHGMSQGSGRGFTYGMSERHDVVAAVKYLRRRCELSTMVVMGTSVGGSATIMAAAIDPTIDIIIAENPITTVGYLQHQHIYNILGSHFRHTKATNFAFQVFRWVCRKWINFRVGNIPSKKCQATHVIASLAPRPVLLMHGTSDEVVPMEHSEILFAKAKEPKELWLAPDGFHCGLYDMFPQEFRRRVIRFIRQYEKGRPQSPAKTETGKEVGGADDVKTANA